MTALLNVPLWLCPLIVLGIIWAFFLAWLAIAMLVNAIGYIAAKKTK